MKKIIYLFVFCLLMSLFVSCDNNNNSSNVKSEDEKIAELLYDEPGATTYRVYFNLLDGSDYTNNYVEVGFFETAPKPETPVRSGYDFIGWFTDKECTEGFVFSTEIIESIMLYAKWEAYTGPDMSYVLDEYVPDKVSDDFTLPTSIEEHPELTIAWTTSDQYTIAFDGRVNPDRVEKTVTVDLEVRDGSHGTHYTKDVIVEPIEFEDLPESGIATGYYAHYNFDGYTEDQLKLDMVIIAFGYLRSGCEINLDACKGNIVDMCSARKSGVRVLFSVQGIESTAHYFTEACKTQASMQLLADNILEVIHTYHFDGVDIDWEFPGWQMTSKNAEAEKYTQLMKTIYETVKADNADYVVSAALPGGSEGYQRYNLSDVAPYLDYLNLMTYDLNADGYCFHHTALVANSQQGTMTEGGVDRSLYLYVQYKGFPSEKICIGIAFYGKVSSLSGTGGVNNNNGAITRTTNNADARTMTYTQIKNKYLYREGDGDVTVYWDGTCHANWIYVKSENIFITYESPKSVLEKCRYALGYTVSDGLKCPYKLAGVMIWDIGEDKTGDLMSAVVKGMQR